MEHALVFASIVLGVAVALELEHLHKLLRSPGVRWHWAQPLFAFFVLLLILSYWWAAAANAEGSITLGAFLPVMAVLVLLVLLAAVALPDAIPPEGIDLAEYYEANRRYQWGLMTIVVWLISLRWFLEVARQVSSLEQFLQVTQFDIAYACLVTAMIFIRRWWAIACAYVLFSGVAVLWLWREM